MAEWYNVKVEVRPEEERDLFDSLRHADEYFPIKSYEPEPGEVNWYGIPLIPQEVARIESGEASNVLEFYRDRVLPNTRATPGQADIDFQKAGKFREWGYVGQGIDVGVIDDGLHSSMRSGYYNIKAARSELGDSPFNGAYAGHGTWMTSLAVPDQGRLVIGRASSGGGPTESAAAASLNWMADVVKVHAVSMSFGGYSPLPALQAAMQNAHSKGVTTFASAGNDASGSEFFPGSYASVCVGGMNRHTGQRWAGSNFGGFVDLYVSCVDCKVYNGANDVIVSNVGTSGATAFAMWLWSMAHGKAKGRLTPQQVVGALKNTKSLGPGSAQGEDALFDMGNAC